MEALQHAPADRLHRALAAFACQAATDLDPKVTRGAKATIMEQLGHFPMSENPQKFREYLLPLLEEIRLGK